MVESSFNNIIVKVYKEVLACNCSYTKNNFYHVPIHAIIISQMRNKDSDRCHRMLFENLSFKQGSSMLLLIEAYVF